MKLKHAVIFVTALTAVAVVSPAVMAETQSTKTNAAAGGKTGPCHDDVLKFCKDVRPGAGRLHTCLSQHEAELAPACRDSRQQAKDRAAKFHQACDADIQKLCKGVRAGHGRVATCLKAKEAELSPACKAESKAGNADAAQLD